MTLPVLQVLLDDGSGTFPHDITTYVLSADGYEVSRGRDDWQGGSTAGQLTLTLNNSDGRFTPGSTILGTPSPIVVDQRIRVVESIAGIGFGQGGFGQGPFGGALNRFTGYVKSWPVSWPAVVTSFATVQVTATDAQARAERRTLRSMLEEEILLRSPSAYYTLGEAEGATSAGDTSGQQAPTLGLVGQGAALAFGSQKLPTLDGATGVTFAGGQYLGSDVTTSAVTGSIGVRFVTSTTPTAPFANVMTRAGSSFTIDTSGALSGFLPGFPTVTGPSVVDGKPHTAFVVSEGTTASLVLDGVVVATSTGPGAEERASATYVGGSPAFNGGAAFTGTIAWAAAWPSLTVAAAQAINDVVVQVSKAADARASGEPGTARITRLASYAGIPVGAMDASLTNVPAQATAGQSAQEAIQAVADAELGLVFVDGSGNLRFHNRNRVTVKTAPDLTLDARWVTPDVAPVVDDQRIVNYFEATAEGTGGTSVARNAASETSHGRYPTSQSWLVQTDQEALDRANWTVGKFAEPTPRYGTLTINLYGMTAQQANAVYAALDLNAWVRITSLASQDPSGTVADVVIQGWRTTATGESWQIACNVVSRSLYTAGLYDDAGSLYDSAVYAV